MKKDQSRMSVIVLLCVITFAVVACIPKAAPLYKGGLAQEPNNMTPYVDEENTIQMALPPGWKSVPLPEGAANTQKAQFIKHGSDAVMRLFCVSSFSDRDAMHLWALSYTTELDPAATSMWETQNFGGNITDPEFEAWTGVNTENNYYLGWKFTRGFSCRYVLVMIVPKDDADYVEGDFLATVRSLRH